jgi:hypothetical protein
MYRRSRRRPVGASTLYGSADSAHKSLTK